MITAPATLPHDREASQGHRRVFTAATVIAVVAAAAMQSASADSPGRKSLLSLPAATAEASPAAVLSETPFQKHLQLTCNSTSTTCSGRLPAVRAKERLAIQFVSCIADGHVDATLRYFLLQVTDAQFTKQLALHYVAPTYRSHAPPFNYVASQPMVLAVEANSVLHLAAVSIGGVSGVQCGLSGVKQRLG